MKDITLKQAFRHGFTLIELMIVIVILGILMGTILPRLTGAQARARDTGRIADLSNIMSALSLYSTDYGHYPPLTSKCLVPSSTTGLSAGDKTELEKVEAYLQGKKIPAPSASDAILPSATGTALCTGAYFYETFKWRQVNDAAVMVAAKMDTFQLANTTTDVVNTVATGTYTTDDDLQTAFGTLDIGIDARGSANAALLGYYKILTQ